MVAGLTLGGPRTFAEEKKRTKSSNQVRFTRTSIVVLSAIGRECLFCLFETKRVEHHRKRSADIGGTITNSIMQWLQTNAPAAWISAFVAFAVLVLNVLSRNRPQRIVVEQMSSAALIFRWKSIAEKTKITFEGREVSRLAQLELRISNTGSDDFGREDFDQPARGEHHLGGAHEANG